MIDIQAVFIALLRAELLQSDTLICHDSVEENEISAEGLGRSDVLEPLCRLAAAHDLTHMVGAALYRMGVRCDEPYTTLFKRAQIQAIVRCEQLKYELSAISSVFESCKLRYIPLKGSVLREFYPRADMRTSCDIDILIDEGSIDTAAEALVERLGYKRGKTGSHDVAFTAPSGVSLELHYTLIEEKSEPRIQSVLSEVWSYAHPTSEGTFCHRMKPIFFRYYHLAHMVKHFKYGGCGVRPFMDLWVLEHRAPSLSEEERTELSGLLRRSDLEVFAERAARLSEVWFSGAIPDEREAELFSSMTEYLLCGGIYGSTENRVAVGRMEKRGRLSYLCSRLFLPYDTLKYDYPMLGRHPSLLPFYEVHRWFRLFSGTTVRRITREVKINGSMTSEERYAMTEMFRRLGLR